MKCLAVLYVLCLAVTPVMAAPAGTAAPGAAPSAVPVGGVLDIQVAGEPALSHQYTVDASGHITVDLIGQVAAAGRTPDQITEELRTRLKEYLKEPSVTVAAVASLHQSVQVIGEVLRPGPVDLRPGDGLLAAIAAAGGLGPNADGAHATLVRRGQSQPESIHLDRLMQGDLSQNLSLDDGDVIQVPRKEISTYQVVGEVKLPGLKPLAGTTRVMDAILGTGGLTDRADRNRIVLMRKDEAKPLVIDLDRVLAGDTSANVLIQPGDMLTVAARMAVQVFGDVRTPGERLLRNGGTLMEAILASGGFSPVADRSAIEITHVDGTMEKASLAGVTTVLGGPALRPGDLIVVKGSKAGFVTLFGAFHNAGSMPYQSGMKITDALIAGGLLENANWKEIRVIRGENGSSHQTLAFNLEAYLKSPQTKDLALEPGDRIIVQAAHQGGASVLQRLIQLMPLANLFFYLR